MFGAFCCLRLADETPCRKVEEIGFDWQALTLCRQVPKKCLRVAPLLL